MLRARRLGDTYSILLSKSAPVSGFSSLHLLPGTLYKFDLENNYISSDPIQLTVAQNPV